jgi:predicted aminopeptidase
MNLTASEKFQLKAFTWRFPLLGTVSYKGFFNFEKGKREAEALKNKNYDVEYSSVSAWSTLGWFRDPVFSGMLRRNSGQLAELIIHEMTHATLYLKSSVDFNENLASAVGETGAEKFLVYKYGSDSQQLLTYLNEQDDYNLFARHMLAGTRMLDSLYNSFAGNTSAEKEGLKKEMIEKIISELDTLPFHNLKYKSRFSAGELPNNAYFLSFVRYDSQKDEMKKELKEKFKGDIKSYLKFLKDQN